MNDQLAIALINAISGMLSAAKQANIAWPDLRRRISAAESQGRVFGAIDIKDLQAKDDADAADFDRRIKERIDSEGTITPIINEVAGL